MAYGGMILDNQMYELTIISYVLLIVGIMYTTFSKVKDYKRFMTWLEETNLKVRKADRELYILGSMTLILIMIGFTFLYWTNENIFPPYLLVAGLCFVIPDMMFTRWFSKLQHNYDVVDSWITQIQFKMILIHHYQETFPEQEKEQLIILAHEFLQKGYEPSGLWNNYLLMGLIEQIKNYEKSDYLHNLSVELALSENEQKDFIENKKY